MLTILFWILVLMILVIVVPDRWHARQEIAKRGLEIGARNVKIVAAQRRKMHGGRK